MKKIIIYTLFFSLLNSIQGMEIEQYTETPKHQSTQARREKVRKRINEFKIKHSEDELTNKTEVENLVDISDSDTEELKIYQSSINSSDEESIEYSGGSSSFYYSGESRISLFDDELSDRVEALEKSMEEFVINLSERLLNYKHEDQEENILIQELKSELAQFNGRLTKLRVAFVNFRKSIIQSSVDEETIKEMIFDMQNPIYKETIQRMISDIPRPIEEEIIQQIISNPIDEETIQQMRNDMLLTMVRISQLSNKIHNQDIEIQKPSQISKGSIILTVFLTYVILEYIRILLYTY